MIRPGTAPVPEESLGALADCIRDHIREEFAEQLPDYQASVRIVAGAPAMEAEDLDLPWIDVGAVARGILRAARRAVPAWRASGRAPSPRATRVRLWAIDNLGGWNLLWLEGGGRIEGTEWLEEPGEQP